MGFYADSTTHKNRWFVVKMMILWVFPSKDKFWLLFVLISQKNGETENQTQLLLRFCLFVLKFCSVFIFIFLIFLWFFCQRFTFQVLLCEVHFEFFDFYTLDEEMTKQRPSLTEFNLKLSAGNLQIKSVCVFSND